MELEKGEGPYDKSEELRNRTIQLKQLNHSPCLIRANKA
jgi:hypothetical protein